MSREAAMWPGALCELCGALIAKNEFPRLWISGEHPEYVHEDCFKKLQDYGFRPELLDSKHTEEPR